MMKSHKKQEPQSPSASARVVEGKLILSFPDALSPVVWQMNLNEVAAAALRVEERAKIKNFALVMVTQDTTMDIASFTTREQAVDALMAASSALENAAGRLQTSAASVAHAGPYQPAPPVFAGHHAKPKRGWMKWSLAILGLIALFFYWGSLQPRAPQSWNDNDVAGDTGAAASGPAPQQQSGVPVSADEFLLEQQ